MLNLALADNRGFRGHELTEIRPMVLENRRFFLEKWREYFREKAEALSMDVACTEGELRVVLSDGRTVAVPLAWFPRLARASAKQRAGWELIGGGVGIHWEAVDEDISVASLLQPENFMRLPDKALPPTTRARRAVPGTLSLLAPLAAESKPEDAIRQGRPTPSMPRRGLQSNTFHDAECMPTRMARRWTQTVRLQ